MSEMNRSEAKKLLGEILRNLTIVEIGEIIEDTLTSDELKNLIAYFEEEE